MIDLINGVESWAEEKGIYKNSTADAQKLLCYAEAGELSDELAKGNFDTAEMELGDVIVTWINHCKLRHQQIRISDFNQSNLFDAEPIDLIDELMNSIYFDYQVENAVASVAAYINTTPEIALNRALEKITKRKGKMIGDKFVKESDLN